MMKSILFFGSLFFLGLYINPVFAQDDSQINDLTFATWVIALGTISVGIVSIIMLVRSHGLQSKDNEVKLFLNISQNLDSTEHRRARRGIYEAYLNIQDGHMSEQIFFQEGALRDHAELIKSTYQKIAMMIEKNYFPEDLFLEMYSGSIAKSWIALEKLIVFERKKREEDIYQVSRMNELFLIKFENLARKAIEKRERMGLSNKIVRMQKFSD